MSVDAAGSVRRMSIDTTLGAEIRIKLSPEAVERVRELIGLGLAASVEDHVADSVRNRLAGFQDLTTGRTEGTGGAQPPHVIRDRTTGPKETPPASALARPVCVRRGSCSTLAS
ncbi:hypothetical protein [Embleya hyalina]|uniref:hypothetical protein n=1 Tax=Embleya hyalina TaxID=516124 RepID=UPI000F8460C9|nr:hypothetical protein [Embleya hyalina]